MMVTSTPVRLSEEELMRTAYKPRKLDLNRLIVRGREIEKIRLLYVEYLLMDYEIIPQRPFAWFGKKKPEPAGARYEKICLLGNGSTGFVSVVGVPPETEETDLLPEQIQRCDYRENHPGMQRNAKLTAIKFARRQMGGFRPDFKLVETRSLYRPFWIVQYSGGKKDGRVLINSHAADGYQVRY